MTVRYPNPELSVGADNKQWWNRAENRRHGFHNAHRLFRRAASFRAPEVVALEVSEDDAIAALPETHALCAAPEFSALVVAREGRILLERAAPDFASHAPHSIQSITKLHMHLIAGRLIAAGRLDPERTFGDTLPDIGGGYAQARVQDALDMNLANGFTEDYDDPLSDCYAEEIALGWRLPGPNEAEPTLGAFVRAITGGDPVNRTGHALYKSANTDALTLLCDALLPGSLLAEIERTSDAAGYEGAFHVSLSPEHLPAFSGGGCLSARDLARFGLLLMREGGDFLRHSMQRPGPTLPPPKDWLRYSNHLMTDGRLIGHAGYGGQFLMVDTLHGTACAYLSVLENESGYDDAYMARIIDRLRAICVSIDGRIRCAST